MPDAEREKARDLAVRFPAEYELDRNGALAVRGEVLAVDLPEKALAAARNAGFTIVRQGAADEMGLSLVVFTHPKWRLTKMVARLRKLAPDAAIEPDHVFFASGAKRTRIRSTPRRVAASGSASSWRLGIIDTGAALRSEPGVQVLRRGFAPGGFVAASHGTAVAAIAGRRPAGRPGQGMGAKLYLADIFGSGPGGGSVEQMLRALDWMAQQRVPVTNISMVGPYNSVLATAIARLARRGFVIVAPVGNDGARARPLYPASLDGVVAVTGVDQRGILLPEASRVRKVDFAAPGIATVTDMSGRPVQVRGTSFASPVVAHRLAELLAVPNRGEAEKAIAKLATAAWKPEKLPGDLAIGRGVVGLATRTLR